MSWLVTHASKVSLNTTVNLSATFANFSFYFDPVNTARLSAAYTRMQSELQGFSCHQVWTTHDRAGGATVTHLSLHSC